MKDFTMSRYSLKKASENENRPGGALLQKLLMFAGVLIFFAGSSYAQEGCTLDQVDDLFTTIEIDGQPGDWNLLDLNPQVTYSHISDPWGSGVVDDQFTQGSKDPDKIAKLRWANGQTKNKNDIANAAGFLQSVECGGMTYTRLFFAGDRLSTNGTSQIGMWFYQGGVAPVAGGTFEGEHKDGDILALINFTGGGSNAQVEIYSWNEAGTGAYGGGNLDFLGTEQHRAVQIQTGAEVPENWDFPELNGEKRYDVNQFFEGYINLNAFSDPDLDYCFNRFLIEGRSSQTLTASLDDFASGELNIKPSVTVNSVAVCDGEDAVLTAVPGSGSVADYNFHWSGPDGAISENDSSITVSKEGTYSVSVSYKVLNIDCQSDSASGTVEIYALPELEIDATNVTCYDAGDGTVIIPDDNTYSLVLYRSDTETGTFAVVVPDPAVDGDGDFIDLGAGWYYVKASESHAQGEGEDPVVCTADSNKVQITEPEQITVSIEPTNVSCYEAGDGVIAVNASGEDSVELYRSDTADGTFTLVVNPTVDADGNFTDLGPGFYKVKAIAAGGNAGDPDCFVWSEVEQVMEPVEITVSIEATNITCYEDGDGIVEVTASGEDSVELYRSDTVDGTYILVVNPAVDANGNFIDLGPGFYKVKAIAAGGNAGDPDCFAWSEAEQVIEPDQVLVAGTGYDPTCEDLSGGYIEVDASGYDRLELWKDGMNTGYTEANLVNGSFVNLAEGSYVIKAFANGGNGEEDACTAETGAIVLSEPVCDMEACTLGYWKEHTDRWDCYYTCTLYSEVFGVEFPNNSSLTLLEALNLGGGGIYNLARQSVAALLNICHDDISYPYPADPGLTQEQTLINAVQQAFNGGDPGALASHLDMINNTYDCPMGGSSATTAETCPETAPASESFSVEAAAKGDIILTPNPFRDVLKVTYDFDYTSDVFIEVYAGTNLVRSLSAKGVSKGSSTDIDLGSYPSQMFIVRVKTSKEVISKQASKQ